MRLKKAFSRCVCCTDNLYRGLQPISYCLSGTGLYHTTIPSDLIIIVPCIVLKTTRNNEQQLKIKLMKHVIDNGMYVF